VVNEPSEFDKSEPDVSARPGLLERRGEHQMRERARAWCRAHPDEAAALPQWKTGLLRAILNEKDAAPRPAELAPVAGEEGDGADAPQERR
jgi:hypothetical protein